MQLNSCSTVSFVVESMAVNRTMTIIMPQTWTLDQKIEITCSIFVRNTCLIYCNLETNLPMVIIDIHAHIPNIYCTLHYFSTYLPLRHHHNVLQGLKFLLCRTLSAGNESTGSHFRALQQACRREIPRKNIFQVINCLPHTLKGYP